MRISIFILCFLLVGCTPKVIITPDKLPDAIVGELYYAEIEINGGSGPVSYVDSNVSPNVLLVIRNTEKQRNFYNSLSIYETPETTGNITIKISGDMISTGWRASSEFEKTYVIKVKERQ